MSPIAILNHSLWYSQARIRTVYGNSAGRTIVVLLAALFFLSMGLGLAMVSQMSQIAADPNTIRSLTIGLGFFVAYFTLIRWFIPGYQNKVDKIPALLPVPPGARHAIDVLTDLTTPSQVAMWFVPIGLILGGGSALIIPALSILGIQWSAHLLRRCIQVVLERRLKFEMEAWLATILAITSGATIWYTFRHLSSEQVYWLPHLVWLQLLALDALLHRLVIGNRNTSGGSGGKWGGFSLLWQHKPTRQMLVFAVLFKLFFLYVYGLVLYPPGSEKLAHFSLDGLHPMLFLMIGPWILSSYIFNNTWGYYPGLWLQVHRSNGQPGTLVASQVRLALPAYFLDTIISLGFWLLLGLNYGTWSGQLLGFWLVGAVATVPIMVIASMRSPRILPTGGWFSFRQRTSQLYGWVFLGLVVLQMLVFVHWLAWVLVLIALGTIWWWLFDTLRDYPRLAYDLYTKLFKPEAK